MTSDYRYGPSVASSIYGPSSISPRPEHGGFGTALPGLPGSGKKNPNRRGPSGPIVPSPEGLDSTFGSSYGLGSTVPQSFGLAKTPVNPGVAGVSSGLATGGLIKSPKEGAAGYPEESPRPIRESDRRSTKSGGAGAKVTKHGSGSQETEVDKSGSPLRNLANRPEDPEKAMHRQSEQFEDVGSGNLRLRPSRGESTDLDMRSPHDVSQAGSINSPPARLGGTRSPLEAALESDIEHGGLRSKEPEIVVDETRPAAKSMIYL